MRFNSLFFSSLTLTLFIIFTPVIYVLAEKNYNTKQPQNNHLSLYTGEHSLPIEITVIGQLPKGTGKQYITSALKQQSEHPTYIDEYNEPSALIGAPDFTKADPTALYSFAVDKRDLIFHRHAGHRIITAVTGEKGCVLKFSTWSSEDGLAKDEDFIKNMYIVEIPGDRIFTLRFDGNIYHQFSPKDYSENAFFATSVHTNEIGGLSGKFLQSVLAGKGNIPLLTLPIPKNIFQLLQKENALKNVQRFYF
jgi:hypothetical protein